MSDHFNGDKFDDPLARKRGTAMPVSPEGRAIYWRLRAEKVEAALAESDREWKEIAASLEAESADNFADAERAEARIKELEAYLCEAGGEISDLRVEKAQIKEAADALADNVERELSCDYRGNPPLHWRTLRPALIAYLEASK